MSGERKAIRRRGKRNIGGDGDGGRGSVFGEKTHRSRLWMIISERKKKCSGGRMEEEVCGGE